MTRSRLFDIPNWPLKGTRRKLEAIWLNELETNGMPEGLLQPPSHPPPQLFKSVEQFNNGLFWECHETLEEVWLETLYPMRFFYHAIIKVSVGFHHLNRHNKHGTHVKLGDAVRLLPFFQPQFLRLRTDSLLLDTSSWLEYLNDPNRIDWAALDARPKPVILIVD